MGDPEAGRRVRFVAEGLLQGRKDRVDDAAADAA